VMACYGSTDAVLYVPDLLSLAPSTVHKGILKSVQISN
jgi:hypothetical protein